MTNIPNESFNNNEARILEDERVQRHIADLRSMIAQGKEIDVFTLCMAVSGTRNAKLIKFITDQELATAREWEAMCIRVRQIEYLGAVPLTSKHFVELWTARNKARVTYQGKVVREVRPRTWDPVDNRWVPITAEDRQRNVLLDDEARIQEAMEYNLDDMSKDMRQCLEEYSIKINHADLEDAINRWFYETKLSRRMAIFKDVCYRPSTQARANWAAFTAAFDLTEEEPAEFVEAVFRKFIWQVKRKMLGMPVSNHLMPVVLGKQGKGKSTLLLTKLLAPVEEVRKSTDFSKVTDGKSNELFENFVLFIDEMGFAAKSDVETVKNIITADDITRRILHTNLTPTFRQNATFIGCTNKKMQQLFQDETGNRRFVGVQFSLTQDWKRTNSIDPYELWYSVNERGEDPMEAYKDMLEAQQASVVTKSAVHLWAEAHRHTAGRWIGANDLFKDFIEWTNTYHPNHAYKNQSAWTSEMSRLISDEDTLGWARKKIAKGYGYQKS